MASPKQNPPNNLLRLTRFLASCGFGSRRNCEAWIKEGKVMVDGEIVQNPGFLFDPTQHEVFFDGQPAHAQKRVYYLLNKPRDVICSSKDERGRRTCLDLLPPQENRIYTVGRLDRQSEGLILLTNDGKLAHRIMHPRHTLKKVYRLKVSREVTADEQMLMLEGIPDAGEILKALAIDRFAPNEYKVVLSEGRNRQLHRMFSFFYIKVLRLKRIRLGPLTLKGLKIGKFRRLKDEELAKLRHVLEI